MKRCKKIFTLFLVLLAIVTTTEMAHGAVNLKNGNFYISYTDLLFNSEMEFKILRTYNSKSEFVGIFGRGWGTPYETYLKVISENLICVYENGGGARNYFYAQKKTGDKFVNQTVEAARRAGKISSEKELKRYRARLKRDVEFLVKERLRLRKENLLPPAQIPLGTRFASRKYGNRVLEKIEGGFLRRHLNKKKTEHYNQKGKLVQISDQKGNYIKISYNSDGKFNKIFNNHDHTFLFRYNRRGQVVEVRTLHNRKSSYGYNSEDQLIYSNDVGGNEFHYQYQGNNYLTQIKYSDGTTRKIEYYENDYREVKKITQRDGRVLLYRYDFKKRKDGTTYDNMGEVTLSTPQGKIVYRKKMVENYKGKREILVEEVKEGFSTRTIADLKGRPKVLLIKDKKYRILYNDKKQIKRVISPREIIEFTNDPQKGEITEVKYLSRDKMKLKKSIKYRYNSRGQLVQITSSQDGSFSFKYRKAGRLERIEKKGKWKVQYFYEKLLYPEKIEVGKLGSITLFYGAGGWLNYKTFQGDKKKIKEVMGKVEGILQLAAKEINFYKGKISSFGDHICIKCASEKFFQRAGIDRDLPKEDKRESEKGPSHLVLHNDHDIFALDLDSKSKKVITGDYGSLKRWNISAKKSHRSFYKSNINITTLQLSRDKTKILAGGKDKILRLWDLKSGKVLQTFRGHMDWVLGARFSPDGKEILSAGKEGALRIWDIETGEEKEVIWGHEKALWVVNYSGDGKYFLSGGLDKTIKIWDGRTKKLVHTLKGHKGSVLDALFSPDGKLVYSASSDKTIKIWEVATGTIKATLQGHHSPVRAIDLSADGKRLLSGSYDRTVKLWDLNSQKAVKTFHGHKGWVLDVAFYPDGKHFLSAGSDKTLRFWTLAK